MEQLNKHTHQSFIPEKTASPHPRFLGLAKSIYERREKKVEIKVPLYQDENTDLTSVTDREPFAGQIYMDSMHFGMGASCLQITYESQNISHARFLYDMFLPWTPIMSALSATSPLIKGQISDHDFRWEILEMSVDCRNLDEQNPASENFIPKSRYSTVSRYISDHQYVKEFHNDVIFKKVCPEVLQALTEKGLDKRLADHVASLFIRSPIPVYENELAFPCCQEASEEIRKRLVCCSNSPAKKEDSKANSESGGSPTQEDNKSDDRSSNNEGAATNSEKATSLSSFLNTEKECTDEVLGGICTAWFLKCPPIDGNSHFENLQSTNWNSLRFKNPPTEDSEIGWRVEFRPMDI